MVKQLLAVLALWLAGPACALQPCRIEVVDAENGWPVPLVELTTTHNVRFVTDNAGVVAFDLPELMGVETWLSVEGSGYSVAEDGFGYRGVRLTPRPGETRTVRVDRALPAKRLGRITGAGLFAESQKLGRELDWREQRVVGCDSVQNALHNGRLYWGWGDTALPGYPLGLFHMTGATTAARPLGSFEPPVRLRYDYVADQRGAPRAVAPLPGDGPTWLGGYASLPDAQGKNHLVACYAKIRPPLEAYETGLCVWNQQNQVFEKLRRLWTKSEAEPTPPPAPTGHAALWRDPSGADLLLFGDPLPSLSCPASFEAWSDPATWKILEPQVAVATRAGGQRVNPHRGAIAYSGYRQKWVAVFTQQGGEASLLGEIWYAEADSPLGPWGDAVHVATHPNYTFYNPQLHPEFTGPESPVLLFEGTYTHTFSGNPRPTARHDYNQVLYRLDLDELAAGGK
ncbi:hypothetical protein Pla175_08300 [Pirellulimonas nuda]|uniref:DUF4185 domain-containing protein n=1 Tax=Pirellulimonas nuda TaxID=2528009 RepID=A0A518D7K8_9BACT|nr:hypothetical protein [Pirellulimonas nuda]QDU87468.1 hypothetical protein Pla175_08300 [Pirellulimonas nuda]